MTGVQTCALPICPRVQEFWMALHDFICEVLGNQIPFCPTLFVLGDPLLLETRDKHLKTWIHTSLMIGRQVTLRRWKEAGPPSFQEWVAEMGKVAAYEKLSFKLFGCSKAYRRNWDK